MHKLCLSLSVAAGIAATGLCAEGESATGTAAPIAAEDVADGVRAISPADIGYSPNWSATGVSGGRVVLRKVVNADTSSAVTSLVSECAVDASGVYPLAIAADAERNVRLLHATEVDGQPIGRTLVADLGFGKESAAPSAAIFAASTNALQTIADAKGVAPLAYSTDWTTGVARVSIDYSYEQWKKDKKHGEGSGTLFSADAEATGAFDYNLGNVVGGDYTLTYTMYGEGDEVLDTYTALFSLPVKLGLILLFK